MVQDQECQMCLSAFVLENTKTLRPKDRLSVSNYRYCVFGIAAPRWQVTHCTLTTSAWGLPSWPPKVSLIWPTILIITRAVFFVCLSSGAASIGITPFSFGGAPVISTWQ